MAHSFDRGSLYTVALVLVAIGYFVLLFVLINDEPDFAAARRAPANVEQVSRFARASAANAADAFGAKPSGFMRPVCTSTADDRWSCSVSGLVASGTRRCTMALTIDSHRFVVTSKTISCF